MTLIRTLSPVNINSLGQTLPCGLNIPMLYNVDLTWLTTAIAVPIQINESSQLSEDVIQMSLSLHPPDVTTSSVSTFFQYLLFSISPHPPINHCRTQYCNAGHSALQDSLLQDSLLQDNLLQDSPLQHSPLQDTVLQDTVLQDNLLQDTLLQALQDTRLQDTPLQDTPLQDTPLQDTRLQDTPLQDFFQ